MSDLIKYPTILSENITDERVQLELFIPEDLHYFKGHFPVAPVLPGVAQTHWSIEYLEKYFAMPAKRFSGFSNLKFQIIAGPNYTLLLELKKINPHKFAFSYSSAHGQHASGKVLYLDD